MQHNASLLIDEFLKAFFNRLLPFATCSCNQARVRVKLLRKNFLRRKESLFSPTVAVLEKFDNEHEFERMCADILIALGYEDVMPVAPRGGSDGGMDITFKNQRGEKGLACVTLRKDIMVKFKEDFSQRTAGEFNVYILFCTKYLTHKQKLEFAKYCLNTLQAEFVPKDIEALRSLLDSSLRSIRETYLHIKDDSKGVSEEALATLQEEMQRQREADRLLLEADKFASSLIQKDGLVRKAVELYPPYKQRELRQLGIEMSTAVIDGYDPIKQMGMIRGGLGRGMVGFRKLQRTDIAWLTTRSISYLRETVLDAATPDGEGLLYLACMYGYQQQFEEMMKTIDKAVKIDAEIKEGIQQRKILLTLLRAGGSDQMKLQRLRKRLGIPHVSKTTFCKFIQDFDLTDFHGFIQWIALKRPGAAGERGIFIIKISPPYVQNKGLVSASALSVESWKPDNVANGDLVSISKLYNELQASFILISPSE